MDVERHHSNNGGEEISWRKLVKAYPREEKSSFLILDRKEKRVVPETKNKFSNVGSIFRRLKMLLKLRKKLQSL